MHLLRNVCKRIASKWNGMMISVKSKIEAYRNTRKAVKQDLNWRLTDDTYTPAVINKLSRKLGRTFKVDINPIYETMFGYNSVTTGLRGYDEWDSNINGLCELAEEMIKQNNKDIANDIIHYIETIPVRWDIGSIRVLDELCTGDAWIGEERNREFEQIQDNSMVWLVDVESGAVVQSKGNEKYIAYSHRWDEEQVIIPNKRTVIMIYNGIEYTWELGDKSRAKTLYMEENAARMGFKHMWVDIKCVCQTDSEIRRKQLKSMASIYANAEAVVVYSQGYSDNFVINYINASVHGRVWTLQESVLAKRIFVFDESTQHCFSGEPMFVVAGALKMMLLERDMVYQRENGNLNYIDNILVTARLRYTGKVRSHREWITGLINRECKFEDDFAYATAGLVYFGDRDTNNIFENNNIPPIISMYLEADWRQISYTYGPGLHYPGWHHMKVPGGELHANENDRSELLNAYQTFNAIKCHDNVFKRIYNMEKVKNTSDYERAIAEIGCQLDGQAAQNAAFNDLARFTQEGENFEFMRETSVYSNRYMVSLARSQEKNVSKRLILVGENGIGLEAILYEDIQLDDTLALVPVCIHDSGMLWVQVFVIIEDNKARYIGEGAALQTVSQEYITITSE